MDYKEKLDKFNSTEKYKSELEFLKGLIGDGYKYVLDYGCGTGAAANYLQVNTNHNVSGYDKTQHSEKYWYTMPTTPFDVVYFMHSLAHIDNTLDVINNLKTKRIIVITPNAEWLALNQDENYTPDPTIKRHFSQYTLNQFFNLAGYKVVQYGQFGKVTNGINERLFLIAEKT